MSHTAVARNAGMGLGAYRYQRHRPEQTLLYQIIEQYYPAFTAHLAEQGTVLSAYVQREFDDFLKCGRLEHGFLRVRCETCRECGGTVKVIACIEDPALIEKILTHLQEKATAAETGLLPESRAPPVYAQGTGRQAGLFG